MLYVKSRVSRKARVTLEHYLLLMESEEFLMGFFSLPNLLQQDYFNGWVGFSILKKFRILNDLIKTWHKNNLFLGKKS